MTVTFKIVSSHLHGATTTTQQSDNTCDRHFKSDISHFSQVTTRWANPLCPYLTPSWVIVKMHFKKVNRLSFVISYLNYEYFKLCIISIYQAASNILNFIQGFLHPESSYLAWIICIMMMRICFIKIVRKKHDHSLLTFFKNYPIKHFLRLSSGGGIFHCILKFIPSIKWLMMRKKYMRVFVIYCNDFTIFEKTLRL